MRPWTSLVHTSFAMAGRGFRVFMSSCPPTTRIRSALVPTGPAAPRCGIAMNSTATNANIKATEANRTALACIRCSSYTRAEPGGPRHDATAPGSNLSPGSVTGSLRESRTLLKETCTRVGRIFNHIGALSGGSASASTRLRTNTLLGSCCRCPMCAFPKRLAPHSPPTDPLGDPAVAGGDVGQRADHRRHGVEPARDVPHRRRHDRRGRCNAHDLGGDDRPLPDEPHRRQLPPLASGGAGESPHPRHGGPTRTLRLGPPRPDTERLGLGPPRGHPGRPHRKCHV